MQDAHNLLRPETVESLFVMWRVTGDSLYRAWGWHIFRAFEKWCRLEGGGYANLHNVLQVAAAPSIACMPDCAPAVPSSDQAVLSLAFCRMQSRPSHA